MVYIIRLLVVYVSVHVGRQHKHAHKLRACLRALRTGRHQCEASTSPRVSYDTVGMRGRRANAPTREYTPQDGQTFGDSSDEGRANTFCHHVACIASYQVCFIIPGMCDTGKAGYEFCHVTCMRAMLILVGILVHTLHV